MSLSLGIVGLPNVGKSTLFNALTRKSVPAENYPFCTIDPSVGIVPVPDSRLEALSKLSHSKKTVPAVVQFVDIAGLVKGASKGEGLGNQFLTNIRDTDAILEVVRIFEDEDVIHVDGSIHPKRDAETIDLELVLADLQSLEKRLGTLERDVKQGNKEATLLKEALLKVKVSFESGEPARTALLAEEEKAVLKQMNFLTEKPVLYCLNKKGGAKNLDEVSEPRFTELLSYIQSRGAEYCFVDARVEGELNEFSEEEKSSLRGETPKNYGIDTLIKKSYSLLHLITFFTTGEDETRGWTIPEGSTAKEAGAAIHSDFRDKFIRAEVVHEKNLLEVGSYASAREKGVLRTEGKEYVVKDGDVIEFKI